MAFQKIYTNIDLIIRVPNIRWILKKRYLEEKTKGDMIIMTVVSMSYLLEAGVHSVSYTHLGIMKNIMDLVYLVLAT